MPTFEPECLKAVPLGPQTPSGRDPYPGGGKWWRTAHRQDKMNISNREGSLNNYF